MVDATTLFLANSKKIAKQLQKTRKVTQIDLEVLSAIHIFSMEGKNPHALLVSRMLGHGTDVVYRSIAKLNEKGFLVRYQRQSKRKGAGGFGVSYIYSLDTMGLRILDEYKNMLNEYSRIQWTSQG